MYSVCSIDDIVRSNISFSISECARILSFSCSGKSIVLARLPENVFFAQEENTIVLKNNYPPKFNKLKKFYYALSGTYRSLVSNVVTGFTKGYEVALRIVGVGYRVVHDESKRTLQFSLGFSHQVILSIPENINADITGNSTIIKLNSFDKQAVTALASKIVRIRKRNVYKCTGIYYFHENPKPKEINKK